jgi:hypothetical protein
MLNIFLLVTICHLKAPLITPRATLVRWIVARHRSDEFV